MAVKFWLCKSEPETYSIDDLKRDRLTAWDCIRNYEARNNLCAMSVGDRILFYHSNAEPPGVIGLAEVTKLAFPDKIQFDKKSDYFDPKATPEKPRWFSPEVKFVEKFPRLIPLEELRTKKELAKLALLQRGSRLSVIPVTEPEFKTILAMA